MKSPFIGVVRHRINTDGKGVFTLAAFHGCTLRCRYCLNPQSIRENKNCLILSPEELLEMVSVDNLYFLATNGGVTFGGGEPLLRYQFIQEFKKICNPDWTINVETSLNVDPVNVSGIADIVDNFVIDIKDFDPEIYRKYTGIGNEKVISNLEWLCGKGLQEKIKVRVPLIKDFNSQESINKTIHILNRLGIKNIDCFNYVIVNKDNLQP